MKAGSFTPQENDFKDGKYRITEIFEIDFDERYLFEYFDAIK